MVRILERIVKELNPAHDYDEIGFHNMSTGNPELDTEGFIKNLPYLITLAKPFVRGGSIGAGLGLLISKITGASAGESMFWGGFIGAKIDVLWYIVRGVKQYADQYLSYNNS